MSQQRLDRYNQLPLSSSMYGQELGVSHTMAVGELMLGNEKITAEDIVKFKKLLGFMDFALGASEELRNLMVAYETKQRILK